MDQPIPLKGIQSTEGGITSENEQYKAEFDCQPTLLTLNEDIEHAIELKESNVHEVVSKWLAENPGCVNIKSNTSDKEGWTALHFAAFYRLPEVTRMLLEAGADPNIKDQKGWNVLHVLLDGLLCSKIGPNSNIETAINEIADMIVPKKGTQTWIRIAQINAKNGYPRQRTALHLAAESRLPKVAKMLLMAGADPNMVDGNGRNVLHTLVRFETETMEVINEIADMILPKEEYTHPVWRTIQDIDAKTKPAAGENSALHYAAEHGYLEVSNTLLSKGADMYAKDKQGDEPVHKAAMHRRLEVLALFIEKDKDCVAHPGGFKKTPLHLAVLSGDLETVKQIFGANSEKLKINAGTRSGKYDTPLHNLILSGGSVEIGRLLLKHGAQVNPPTSKSTLSPFDLAVRRGNPNLATLFVKKGAKINIQSFQAVMGQGYEGVARAVIESDQWVFALRGTYKRGAKETTPFRELVETMPDVAEMVLDRCIVDGVVQSQSRMHCFAVLYYYEFIEDFKPGAFHHNSANQEQSTGRQNLSKGNGTLTYGEIKSEGTPYAPYSYWPNTMSTFNKADHPLQIMVKKERSNLLTHPVVLSLIHSKWRVKGNLLFFLNLLTYVVYLIFLTTFALIVPNPQTSNCQCKLTNMTGLCSNDQLDFNSSGIVAVSVFVLMGGLFRLLLELLQLILSLGKSVRVWIELASPPRRSAVIGHGSQTTESEGVVEPKYSLKEFLSEIIPEYFQDLENWVELAHYSCSIAFVLSVLTADGFCVSNTQWEVGISALFLGWFVFILFTSKIPVIGIYVIILLKISLTVLKLLIFAALLVVSFALAFFLTFTDFNSTRSPFSDVGRSLLKTMTMTTGEVDFDAIFRFDPAGGSDDFEEIPYPAFSYVIWIVFILLMPVILINMLTGLAVGDTNEVLQQAHVRKLSLEVDLVLTIEELQITFGKFLPKCFKRSQHLYEDIHLPTAVRREHASKLKKWVNEFDTEIWVAGTDRYDSSDVYGSILERTKKENLEQRIEGIEEDVSDMTATLKPPQGKAGVMQRIERIEGDVREMKSILKPAEEEEDIIQRMKRMETMLGEIVDALKDFKSLSSEEAH